MINLNKLKFKFILFVKNYIKFIKRYNKLMKKKDIFEFINIIN